MGIERRRASRFSVVDLNLYNRNTGIQIGQVVNISEGGLFVLSTMEIVTGEVMQLQIPFRDENKKAVSFDVDAVVVWCARDNVQHTKYGVGMQFISEGDTKDQYTFLKQMISLYGKV